MSSVAESGSDDRQLSRLKASRTAKKGIITKRIRQIETMVMEKAKRKGSYSKKCLPGAEVWAHVATQTCWLELDRRHLIRPSYQARVSPIC